ncbi:MAG: hypothetical protein GF398_20830 [Chitinivibrionales bacterium]|nr:hypothetical protein [Chitinivibrionales bacterium]
MTRRVAAAGIAALLFIRAQAFIAITEILRNPTGNETQKPGGASHEFIEFCNFGALSFALDGLYLTDGSDSDSVVARQTPIAGHETCIYNSTSLPPGRCALILDRDYSSTAPAHNHPIDSGAILLTVTNATLGSGLTNSRGVVLYRGTGSRIDTIIAAAVDAGQELSLSAGAFTLSPSSQSHEGHSLIPARLLLAPPHYHHTQHKTSAGHFEHIHDGWIFETDLTESQDRSAAVCSVVALAAHVSTAGAASIYAGDSVNANTLLSPVQLQPQASPIRTSFRVPFDTTHYRICIETPAISFCRDINTSVFQVPAGIIRFSEIFPAKTEMAPEWIEVYNTGSIDVDLQDWRLADRRDTASIASTSLIVPANAYHLITRDAHLFLSAYPDLTAVTTELDDWITLNDYGDTLYLVDKFGAVQDSLSYESDWFEDWLNGGLERIDFALSGFNRKAWAQTDSATPGTDNALASWRNDATLEIGPIPFTPDGDGRDDLLRITLSYPSDAKVEVSILGFNGKELIRFDRITRRSIRWTGYIAKNVKAAPGPIFVIATFKQGSREWLIRKKGVVWW